MLEGIARFTPRLVVMCTCLRGCNAMWFLALGMVTNFASSIVNNNGNRKKKMVVVGNSYEE